MSDDSPVLNYSQAQPWVTVEWYATEAEAADDVELLTMYHFETEVLETTGTVPHADGSK